MHDIIGWTIIGVFGFCCFGLGRWVFQKTIRDHLADMPYDDLRELVAELQPKAHLHLNPPKKEKRQRPALSNHTEGC
jgi:hypothetical protein